MAMPQMYKTKNIYYINMISFWALIEKEIKRFYRYWPQTLLPPTITTLLYFIVFGSFLGKHLPNISGVGYMQFITPGLIMMAVIYNAYLNVASSLFAAKFQNYIEEILITPLSSDLLLLAFVFGGVARGLSVALLSGAVAVFYAHITIHSIWLTLLASILISTLFSLAGFINGLIAKNYESVNIMLAFVLTPLSFLGGVFYSSAMLPEKWHWITYFNPIFYLVNAFRYAMIGVSDVPVDSTFIVSIILILIMYVVARLLMRHGIGMKQ